MKISKRLVSIAFVLLSFLSLASISYADYWSGSKTWGGTTIYQYDSSVSSYGYGPHYDAAIANWTSISSMVTFTSGSHSNADKYYIGETSEAGLLGRIVAYNASGDPTSDNGNWHHVNVSGYHNNMESYSMSYAERISNLTHEVGHSLKLAHPSTSQTSVMNQGIQSIGPSTYDQNELKAKWGN
ncbi:MAG: hypothetical protein J7639_27165 [Paenibacillaceae bacterium]|nr:hypothetical protein [Paenibacillaceae bacterium]